MPNVNSYPILSGVSTQAEARERLEAFRASPFLTGVAAKIKESYDFDLFSVVQMSPYLPKGKHPSPHPSPHPSLLSLSLSLGLKEEG